MTSRGWYLALIAAGLAAHAGPARSEPTTQQEQQLLTVEQQMQSSQSIQDRLAAGIAAAAREQDGIAARLVDVSRRVQAAEASISEGEDDIRKLSTEKVTILAKLGEKQDVLSELLAGLQRLEQNPPPALVVEPNDVLSALRGAMMFGTIVPELRAEAEALAADLARLDQLEASIRTRRDAVRDEIASLIVAQKDLAALILRKKEAVASGNVELDSERKRAKELAAKAKSLKQLMASLAEARAKAEAARARADADTAKQAAAAEAARKLREAARQKPRMVFGEARGKLAYPAQGDILKSFGDDGVSGPVQGTLIATRASAQVTSPVDGHVEFAGAFRSYGQVLILNPGGGYHILLAGMETITAGTGEFLRAGEPVGRMGNGPSSVTLLGDVMQDGRPVLYIEFRNSSEAIDSGPWWIGGMREARG